VNEAYGQFLGDVQLRREITQHSFAYTSSGESLSVTNFTPNAFTIILGSHAADTIHITQQYNDNWKATADHHPLDIQKDHIAFMKAALPEGAREIRFAYRPTMVIIFAFVSILTILGCIVTLVYFSRRKK
jgi:uncharacterized membrane protein YfhO